MRRAFSSSTALRLVAACVPSLQVAACVGGDGGDGPGVCWAAEKEPPRWRLESPGKKKKTTEALVVWLVAPCARVRGVRRAALQLVHWRCSSSHEASRRGVIHSRVCGPLLGARRGGRRAGCTWRAAPPPPPRVLPARAWCCRTSSAPRQHAVAGRTTTTVSATTSPRQQSSVLPTPLWRCWCPSSSDI